MKTSSSINIVRGLTTSFLQKLIQLAVAGALVISGERATAQRPLGIDVYTGDGSITWTSVYNGGYVFAWAKASEGVGYQDAQFVNNATNAQKAGVLLGAYHYARYDLNLGLTGATNEANWFWSVAGPYIKANAGNLVPFLDVEQATTNYNMTTLSQWVVTWCQIVSNNAYAEGVVIRPMIYTYPSYASTYLNSTVTAYTLDMATVSPPQNPQTGAPSCSGPWGCNWTVWQYSWTNIVPGVPGVSGECDADVFNGTYTGMIGELCPRLKHPNTDSYCGNDQNGIMEMFLPDAINNMETNAQTCPNCSWSGWGGFGGTSCFGTPSTVGYNADLRMQVFVRAADSTLRSIWQTNVNGGWSSWNNYGGVLNGDVTVGYLSNGAMQIFARSTSNTVMTMWQTSANGGWTAWSDLGGNCHSDPVVGFNADGRMQLFCQTSSNTMQSNFKTTSGSWAGWSDYGGSCVGKPAVGNLENGSMQVFVHSSTNSVRSISQLSPNGTWSGWSDMNGNCVGSPVVGYNADGRIQLFIPTSSNTVSTEFKKSLNPSAPWSGWSNLGGSCYYDLAVGYNGDGRIQLFMRDNNYNVQSIWQTTVASNVWSAYLNMGGNTPAVSITTQPSSQTVIAGQNATFTVVAANALSYQWSFNGGNISGATASSYTVNNAQPANAGTYKVVAANNAGSVTSASATLTVNVPPSITTQPASQTVNQGQNATFSVVASGTAPLTYQWEFNGGNISGATTSSYTVVSAQSTDAGNYSVVITNVAGTVTSANASLTVNIPPSITTQPSSQTVNQGQSATFSVVAAGTAPLSYQWTLNGANISGATASSYTINSAQATDAGTYAVVVNNVAGSVTSANATLTVILPPIIGTQPASQLGSVSNSVTFSVALSQGTSPTYQWSYNGGTISGATASSYTLNNISWSSGGNFSVVVANAAGSVTSSVATLTVEQAVFTYTNGFEGYNLGVLDQNDSGGPNTGLSNPWWGPGPPNMSIFTNVGSIAPHSGSKMMGATVGYEFCQDYINLPYRFDAQQTYYGNLMMDWWFYDPKGTGTGASNYTDYMALAQYLPVSLTNDFVTTTFTQWNQRMSLGAANVPGFSASVYQARIVGATGGVNTNGWFNTSVTRSVGWHHARIVVGIPKNNSGPVLMYIDNMTNAVLSYASSGVSVGFNLIEVNSSFGGINTGGYFDDLTFRAANDPWIAQQPANATVTAGQNAGFSTVAVGTAYQWQFNGSNLSGGTASAYTVTNAQSGNAGTYTCIITGTNGTVTTTPATLTVQ
jgi:GH25 family lysozyme M1 (1,4-beta-N-acetylmuramidase)